MLNTTQCDAKNDPGGSNSPYLLWIFTTDGGSASNATLHLGTTAGGNDLGNFNADKTSGNTFHFVTPYFAPDPTTLYAYVDFTVGSDGGGSWNLVISHGCAGGTVPPAADLTVTKSATPSFTRTYTWGIDKSVDKQKVFTAGGAPATFNYTVTVTHDHGTDSGWQVNGVITALNPNATDFTGVTVTDQIDNGGNCTVAAGSPGSVDPTNATIPADGSVDFPYTCTYASAPSPSNFTNTATAAWDSTAFNTPNGSATGTASDDFANTIPTIVDGSVDVKDTLGGDLGTVSYTDQSPTTFTYPYTFSPGDPAGTCTDHTNTATVGETAGDVTPPALPAELGRDSVTVTDCQGADLAATKDATPSFTRTWKWGIKKAVDKTKVDQLSGSVVFNYTVSVTHDSGTDGSWQVKGKIHVANPNDWEAITLTGVSDAVSNGGSCTVDTSAGLTIPKSGSADYPYTCTYSSAPSPSSGTNTATVTWDAGAASTPDGSTTGTATFDFSGVSPTLVDNCVTVTDTLGGSLGQVCSTDPSPKTFTYSNTVPVTPDKCTTVDNTATFTTNTTGTTGSDKKSVTVCGPVAGGLTMGFWQNKNGQGIITGGSSTAGVCNSGTCLRQYAPFQDLSATATCAQVGTYVTNIIKAANASGASMNAMLKSQMLATALDVYFSDPALGGNKINAPQPIGGIKVDLTKICHMIDGSGGTATCSGSYENTSSAFGGATCLSVSALLLYENNVSNNGGSTWYAQVKATQGLAKDTFDAINNQVAFTC